MTAVLPRVKARGKAEASPYGKPRPTAEPSPDRPGCENPALRERRRAALQGCRPGQPISHFERPRKRNRASPIPEVCHASREADRCCGGGAGVGGRWRPSSSMPRSRPSARRSGQAGRAEPHCHPPGRRASVIECAASEGGPRLGVQIRDIGKDELATLKLASLNGVAVVEVTKDSAAERAGVKANDVIVQFDGENVRSAQQLTRLVRETVAGRTVKMAVMRDGKRIEIDVTPAGGSRSGRRAHQPRRDSRATSNARCRPCATNCASTATSGACRRPRHGPASAWRHAAVSPVGLPAGHGGHAAAVLRRDSPDPSSSSSSPGRARLGVERAGTDARPGRLLRRRATACWSRAWTRTGRPRRRA